MDELNDMDFLAYTPFRFLRICNGVAFATNTMHFIAKSKASRMGAPIPPAQANPFPRPSDVRGATLNRFGGHAGAFCVVLALHLAVIGAFYVGLRAPVVELLVPVQMLAQHVDVPAPVALPTPLPAPPRPQAPKPAPAVKPQLRPAVAKPTPVAEQAPSPLPATPEPSVQQVAAPVAPSPSPGAEPPAPTAPTAAAPAPSAAAVSRAPAPLELPSSDAQYLQNTKPPYPPISMRMGEQGTVLVQVLVSDKGLAKDVKIRTSSGFFRLDQAALEAVARWRFVPGKRAGIAETMWFTVPITFGLR